MEVSAEEESKSITEIKEEDIEDLNKEDPNENLNLENLESLKVERKPNIYQTDQAYKFQEDKERIDVFIKNYLMKFNMERSLKVFEQEFYEGLSKGEIDLDKIGTVPEVYIKSEQIQKKIGNFQKDLDAAKIYSEKANSKFLKLRKAKESEKIRHRRVQQEKEEERLRKEREELLLREQEEKNKNKQLLNKVQNENSILASERNKNNNNDSEFNNLRTNKRVLKSNVVIDDNNNILEKEAFDRINQKEMESKMKLNNEIMQLREQMKEQQNDLFHQIAFLKQETQNANQQRFEALKEIDKLKDELSKQRADEILRRKYVYDVVVNEAKDANNIVQESHLPKNDKPKVVLPVDSEKDIYYEERIRHPNRVIPVPKLTELNEHGVKTDSKFIDIDTHNLIGGLELYEPNEKLITSQDEDYKINNRGIGIEGDYGTLRGNDNIMRTTDVLMPNSNELNTNQVNISINNKKLKTFKNIKNVETENQFIRR